MEERAVAAAASAKIRLDNLTALRFFAAFSVFLHHLKLLGIDLSPVLWNLNLGWTVSFFFVLSGFVLAYGYDGRIKTGQDAMSFVAIRFFRLWPLHVVCLAIAVALRTFPEQFERWYLILTLQHSFIPNYKTAFFLNGVSWSISDEFFFYLVFAVLLLVPRAFLAVALIWSTAVFALLLIASWTNWLPFVRWEGQDTQGVSAVSFFHLFPPVRIVEFFVGVAAFRIFRAYPMPQRAILPVQALCFALICVYMTVHHDLAVLVGRQVSGLIGGYYSRAGAFPLFALIVYVFAHQHGSISNILSNRVLLWLGETSFALYMVHRLVMLVVLRHLMPMGIGTTIAAIVAFLLSVAVSAALYILVEKPALRWAKRTFNPPSKNIAEPEPLAP